MDLFLYPHPQYQYENWRWVNSGTDGSDKLSGDLHHPIETTAKWLMYIQIDQVVHPKIQNGACSHINTCISV